MQEKIDLLTAIHIRALEKQDLPDLEWDGTYTHYRKLFQIAFNRLRARKGLAWLVELPEQGLIGQVFIQLVCNAPNWRTASHAPTCILSGLNLHSEARGLAKHFSTFVSRI
jgi:hypothetical protein